MGWSRHFAALALAAALPCAGEELAGRYKIEERVVHVLAPDELLEGEALVDLDTSDAKMIVRDRDGYYFIVTRPEGYFLSIGERSFGPFSNIGEANTFPGGRSYRKMELDETHYLLFDQAGKGYGPYLGALWEYSNLHDERIFYSRAGWIFEDTYIVDFDYVSRREHFEGAEEPIYDRDGSIVGKVRVFEDGRELLFTSGARISAACPDPGLRNEIEAFMADESTGDWVLLCTNEEADKPLGGGSYWPGYSIIENGRKIGDFLNTTLFPLEGRGWAAGYKDEDGFHVIDRTGRRVGPAPIPWRRAADFWIEASDEAGRWAGRAYYYDHQAQVERNFILASDGTVAGPFENSGDIGFAGASLFYDFYREGGWYRRVGDRTYGPFDDIDSASDGGGGARFFAKKGTVFSSYDGSLSSSQDLGREFLLSSVVRGDGGAVRAYIGAVREKIDDNGEPRVQYGLFVDGEARIDEIETWRSDVFSFRVTGKGNEVLLLHPEAKPLKIHTAYSWRSEALLIWVNGERIRLDDREPIFGGYDFDSDSLFWLENRDGEIIEKRIRF